MKLSRLRILLIVTMLGAQLGTVAVFVGDARRRVEETLDDQARISLGMLADTAVERVRRFLETAEAPLASAAELIDQAAPGARDDAALVRLFAARLNASDWLRSMYVGRPDGSFLSVGRSDGRSDGRLLVTRVHQTPAGSVTDLRYLDGARPSDPAGRPPRYDPRTRPWYALGAGASGIAWTDPYRYFTGSAPGVSAAIGLHPATRAQAPDTGAAAAVSPGVLGIDIDTRTLSAFVATVVPRGRGTAVLLDADGTVIGASREDWLAPATTAEGGRAPLPSIDEIADGPFETVAAIVERAAAAGPDAGVADIVVDDARHLALARPIPEVGDWRLVVEMPVASYSGALGEYYSRHLGGLLAATLLLSTFALAVILGTTERVARLQRDATRDALTGALARREFERRLDAMLSGRRRCEPREGIVLVVLDLDGFKPINDTWGHAAGDEVLVAFVARLRARLRRGDLLGRIGGDEFALALQLPAEEDPQAVVEGIRRTVIADPVRGARGRYEVGVTAGLATHAPPETRAELMGRADGALVAGKAIEKNRTWAAGGIEGGTSAPAGLPAGAPIDPRRPRRRLTAR